MLFSCRQVANEIAKLQVSINSNDASTNCKKNFNGKWKFATGNTEVESSEYSSSKKLLE